MDSPRCDEIIDVRPDGWSWGREERNPAKFVIAKVPDEELRAAGYGWEGPEDQRRIYSLMRHEEQPPTGRTIVKYRIANRGALRPGIVDTIPLTDLLRIETPITDAREARV